MKTLPFRPSSPLRVLQRAERLEIEMAAASATAATTFGSSGQVLQNASSSTLTLSTTTTISTTTVPITANDGCDDVNEENEVALTVCRFDGDRAEGSLWTSSLCVLAANAAGFVLSCCLTSDLALLHLDLFRVGFALTAAVVVPHYRHFHCYSRRHRRRRRRSPSSRSATINQSEAFPDPPFRIRLSTAFVTVWVVRLSLFLFGRNLLLLHLPLDDDDNAGGDDGNSPAPSSSSSSSSPSLSNYYYSRSDLFRCWIFSTIWGVLCLLPHSVGATSRLPGNTMCLCFGAVLFSTGGIFECVADGQALLYYYRLLQAEVAADGDASCNGAGCRFFRVGLWSTSQNPNFFGNVLLWTGILVLNLPALVLVTATTDARAAMASPIAATAAAAATETNAQMTDSASTSAPVSASASVNAAAAKSLDSTRLVGAGAGLAWTAALLWAAAIG